MLHALLHATCFHAYELRTQDSKLLTTKRDKQDIRSTNRPTYTQIYISNKSLAKLKFSTVLS